MQMDRNPEYDIYKAMQRIENELIESMMRNFDRHRAEEKKEGYNWTAWQAEQLKALEQYKRRNLKKYQGAFGKLNADIESMIRLMRQTGRASQEIGILEALKKGYRIHKEIKSAKTEGRFFKVNDRKLNALIKATMNDMEKAEQAVLRMANDKYRKAIFAAQVYANTGAGTYEKAVDMATKDMLSAGLNCVEYKNGARHTLANYARMAIKTANKRAYLMGEGEKRAEWGVHTVILKKRGNACPLCLPFVGKILIDDVYSGGSKADGNYPLLSAAMAAGLYHPNCKDIHTTYFPGISTPPEGVNKEDVEKAKEDYINEQKQNYCKNNAERFQRMSENSLDPDNKRKYAARAKEWEEKEKFYQKSTGEDSLSVEEQAALTKYISPDSYILNDKLRKGIGLTEDEKDWIMNLDNALDKMPDYEGTVYRSVSEFGIKDIDAFIDGHVVGGRKIFPSYISSSLGVYDESFPIQYVIKSKHGKNVNHYNQSEKEILFKRNSRFLITKVQGNTIWMEEI